MNSEHGPEQPAPPPRRCVELCYEDLVLDPGDAASELLDFLQVDIGPARARAKAALAQANTASVRYLP